MPLKLLVIPGYQIFPIDSGGAHGQLTFLDKQQFQHEVHLIITPVNIDEKSIPSFQKRFPQIILHPIGFKKRKTLNKGKAFLLKQYRKLTYKDISYTLKKERAINGIFIKNPDIVEQIAAITTMHSFDIIQVEHVINLGLVSVLPITTKRIFVHHELHHTRVYQDMLSLHYSDTYANYMASLTKGAEIAWLNQYDGLITFNQGDTNLLKNANVLIPQLVSQPFALFDNQLINIYRSDKTPKLVFLGGETHYPNKEGLQWFLDHVYPLVTAQGHHPAITVTGNWTEEFKKKYSTPIIQFTGFIENLDELLTDAIIIVPIRIGSGIRVKVYTSIAKGLPIVSTALGASGISGLQHRKNILFGETPEAFAQNVVDLLVDTPLRLQLSVNAFALAEAQFKSNKFVEDRNEFYNMICKS